MGFHENPLRRFDWGEAGASAPLRNTATRKAGASGAEGRGWGKEGKCLQGSWGMGGRGGVGAPGWSAGVIRAAVAGVCAKDAGCFRLGVLGGWRGFTRPQGLNAWGPGGNFPRLYPGL